MRSRRFDISRGSSPGAAEAPAAINVTAFSWLHGR
jgi:hypothetical protein